MKSLIDKVIADYINSDVVKKDPWVSYCKQQKKLENAVKVAALGLDKRGMKHPDQRAVSAVTLEEFAQALLGRINDIEKAKTFDELYSLVFEMNVRGIGHHTNYDTVQRIAAYMKLQQKKVYLQGDVKRGVEHLTGKRAKRGGIDIKDLPEPLASCGLLPWQIEEVLCLYFNESKKPQGMNDDKQCRLTRLRDILAKSETPFLDLILEL